MDIVNNRFRIIKSLKHTNLFHSYLVNDIWEDNKIMQLNILHPDNTPKSIINYYSDEFIGLINFNSDIVVEVYNFNVISHIDNKRISREQYFYTCEYIDNSSNLLELSKGMNLNEILNVFIELCKIVNFIHLKGHVYEALNLNNLLVINNDNNYQIKIKDIATKELEKRSYLADNYEDPFFASPKAISNRPERIQDIYSLGVLLLSMLYANKIDFRSTPKNEFMSFMTDLHNNNLQFSSHEVEIINKLSIIINKLITYQEDYPYNSIFSILTDLNDNLNTEFKFNYQKDYSKINFHLKLIGRSEEVNTILTQYDNMINYNPFKKVILVQGDTGSGKTRFLEEIKFRFELEKANLYYSFSLNSLNESSEKMWIDILRKLILETETEIIDKYEAELIKFFPNLIDRKNHVPKEFIEEHQSKYRLLNRIVGFINDSVKNKSTVLIIDNLDFANEFTIDTFTYLYSEVVKNKNIILIFSFNEGNTFSNPRFSNFISNLNQNQDCEILKLTNLNKHESGEMIQNMLDMSYIPVKLSEKIYSQSYGNPLFISEVIKDFYNRRILFISNTSGHWHIDIPDDDDDYKLLVIPNTIEQAVLNQLKDLDDLSNEILKVMSIFPNPISVENIKYFVSETESVILDNFLELTKKGIISRVISSDNLYTINNKVLKDVVYERIDRSERVCKHLLVAEKIKTKSEINYEDLIYHYENANDNKEVIRYCLEYAKKMHNTKNHHEEINYTKKAIQFIEDKLEKTEFLIKISMLYYDLGDVNEALKHFYEAEILANETQNLKQLIDINLNIGKIISNIRDSEEGVRRINYTKELLADFEYPEAQLDIKQIEATTLMQDKKFDQSIDILKDIIDECKDDYPRIKGDCYRLLAYIYSRGNQIAKALDLYKRALKLFEVANCIRGTLISLNNIGTIYSDTYQDEDTAIGYYYKVKNLSEEYNIEHFEIVATVNIACYHESCHNYELTYRYFKQSLEKAIKGNFYREVFFLYNVLARSCLNFNRYTEACNYLKLAQEMINKSQNQALDIIEFYKSNGDLYYTLGNFVKAKEFITKTIEFYESGVDFEQFLFKIQYHIINLRFKENDAYDEDIEEIIKTSQKIISNEMKVDSLCTAAKVLGEKQDYKNGKLLLDEVELSLPESLHDETRANYYVALGVNEKGKKALDYLLKSLKLSKSLKNKAIIADTTILIGDYYFKNKENYSAASYYIEAWDILINIIKDIPREHKLSFINNYKYGRVYYRIKYIYNILGGINIFNNEELNLLLDTYEFNNEIDLHKALNNELANQFMENREFMKFITDQYLTDLETTNLSITDIISNISNDTISNIELVLKYLAATTLSTNALLIIEEGSKGLYVIASINDNYEIPSNKYIFEKTKYTYGPVWASNNIINNDYDSNVITENIKACLCIPITSNLSQDLTDVSINDINNNFIGYLYLESDRIINNFNEVGLHKCLEFINFLALLIEKHHLKIEASADKLTGTLTRKYLEDTINRLIISTHKSKSQFSIIMYDLDDFKNVNDRFGHQTGDEVLAGISKLIFDNIKKTDFIGRYGGEEFIIILPDKNSTEALAIAEDLRVKICNANLLGDKAEISVSMGIATYPDHGQTLEELFEKVDQALYDAKENGKNCCSLWNFTFSNRKPKAKDHLTGILVGNSVIDSRNVLAIVELIQLTNKGFSNKEKIYQFLGRTIEIIDAQYGYLIELDGNNVTTKYGRQQQKEEWLQDIYINEHIVNSVIESHQGLCIIDWDDIGKHNLITGLPDWDSILVVPVEYHGEVKALLYYTVSTRIKEFSDGEYNFINVLSGLVPTIINS